MFITREERGVIEGRTWPIWMPVSSRPRTGCRRRGDFPWKFIQGERREPMLTKWGTALTLFLAAATFGTLAMPEEKNPQAQPPVTEKPKAEKAKVSKSRRVYGIVVAYDAGKMIKLKGEKGQEWVFAITPDAKIKGEVKEGGKVGVVYRKKNDKMLATSISVTSSREKKPPKKE
jgi:Cu/Ag efflux protein CusF